MSMLGIDAVDNPKSDIKLDSETPYRILGDEPLRPQHLEEKKVRKPKMDTTLIGKSKLETPENGLLSEMIDDGNSFDGGESNDSEEIRDSANRILETYNERLLKVGRRSFQVRLNIFFTFVISTSVEAEAYDYL